MGRRAALALLLGLCLVGAGAGAWFLGLLRDPDVKLLVPEAGAQWVRRGWDEGPKFRGAEYFTAAFRTRFRIDAPPPRAILEVRPFRQVIVLLDGREVGRTSADLRTWKERSRFDLAPWLDLGEHELVLSAVNRAGPPAVLAWSDDLGIRTGEGWEARGPRDDSWVAAVGAEHPQANTVGARLPRADRALLSILPVVLPVFAFVSALAFARTRSAASGLRRWTPGASGVRWLVLGAWAVLAANNVHALPYSVGYDVDAHLQYVEFIVRRGGVPFADQGWQMFQAPLFHLVCAPLYLLFRELLSPTEAALALRVVPLLCGALQIELCHRIVRMLHPRREDLQALGTVLGGLLPINVYLSQNLSNEPLLGLLGSALVLVSLGLLRDRSRFRTRSFLLLGALLGLAGLTKTSALLLVPALVCLTGYAAWLHFAASGEALRRASTGIALALATALLVCGWYYARNWWVLGAPVVGGWDPSRGYVWWQEPGYRTIGQFLRFGAALSYPVYSSVHGFWDGFYSTLWLDGYAGSSVEFELSPLWNFDFLLASAWLSLLPTAALLVGAGAILLRPLRAAESGELFALMWLATMVLAMALLALRVPSFSTIKASYTLAGLGCYAAIGARGFAVLIRGPVSRALVSGGMAAWALAVVLAYLVV